MDATECQRVKALLREGGRAVLSSSTLRVIAHALVTRGSSDINEESFIVEWKPASIGGSSSESDSRRTVGKERRGGYG
jgi:hypothetical protein